MDNDKKVPPLNPLRFVTHTTFEYGQEPKVDPDMMRAIGKQFQASLEKRLNQTTGYDPEATGGKLTLNILREAMSFLEPLKFVIAIDDVATVWRLYRLQGWKVRRIHKRYWIQVYQGERLVADLYVDWTRSIKPGSMIKLDIPKFNLHKWRPFE